MKILQINKLYYPYVGGVEKVAYDISNQLNNRVDMNVLVANTRFRTSKEQIDNTNITRIASLGIYFSMPIAPTFPIHLKKQNADIFHFHFPFPLAEIASLLVKPKGKIVVTWHSDIIKQKSMLRLYKPFLLKFLERTDKIITTSPNMIENSYFLNRFKHKCEVIPLGINPDNFILTKNIEDKIIEIKKNDNKPIIFFMGRLVYYKGVEYLVQAMKYIDATLIIGGTGPLKERLEKLAQVNNVDHKIKFMGFIKDEDLPAYYHAAEIFVLPSIENSEAFGIVQLEAQVCGKPVVSTNLSTGVPYANKDGVTGITVPPKDEIKLANAINTLLNNNRLREELGENARKRVLSEFTIEIMGNKYFDLYKRLLK